MGSLRASEGELSSHLGQRLSYEGSLCTVRYHGALPGTKGVWLGVEWDDVDRGKHDGSYQGRRYFHCLSSASIAGSFIRPSRTPDPQRSFMDALRFKYAAEDVKSSTSTASKHLLGSSLQDVNVIEISGKVVEEVGFEQIRQHQAVLQNLRIVLLDGLCVSGITLGRKDPAAITAAQEAVAQTCPELVELDLGWNLLETWTAVAEICLTLQKIQVLKMRYGLDTCAKSPKGSLPKVVNANPDDSGLRLHQLDLPWELEEKRPFRNVVELHINENLLQPEHIPSLVGPRVLDLQRFPKLKVLSLSQNRLCHFRIFPLGRVDRQLSSLTTLILDGNVFESLAFLSEVLYAFPDLKNLSLQGNQISSVDLQATPGSDQQSFSFPQLESLNLSHNLIQDYSFIDMLPRLFPKLTSLRVSNNPFFLSGTSTDPANHDELLYQAAVMKNTSFATPARASHLRRSSRSDTAYSLTLARIPTLSTLNHSTITSRDREEGEIYYTSLAEREFSAAIAKISGSSPNRELKLTELRKQYPRYEELCQKYDRESVFHKMPSLSKDPPCQSTYAPGTLGARLIKARFYISPRPPTGVLPPTFSRLIPSTISVYTLKALLSRTFDLPALRFRLIYESAELDPVQDYSYQVSSWDRWGDWDLDHPPLKDDVGAEKEGKKWKKREVEIKDGTREWGFFVQDGVRKVTVRVEPLNQSDGVIGKS